MYAHVHSNTPNTIPNTHFHAAQLLPLLHDYDDTQYHDTYDDHDTRPHEQALEQDAWSLSRPRFGDAERECKQVLECSTLTKEDLGNGFIETTCPSNIDRVKDIFAKHDSVRVVE